MDVRQLRQFIAVAEDLNFRRAAVRLKMAQPPLSQSIKRLETELGVQLLLRNRKSVQLTPAGTAFLAEARRTLVQLERAANIARRAGSGTVGSLRVAFIGSAAYSRLPEAVRLFRQRFPDVELELVESTSMDIIKLLDTDQVDIGFLRPVIGLTNNFRTESIEKDKFIVALPAGHKLARHATLSLAQLADYPFVLFSATRSPTLYQQILMLCRHASFTPRIAQEARQVQTVISLVSAGLGIALVPGAVARLRDPTVVYKTLRDRSPHLVLELISARRADNVSPMASAFGQIAKKVGKGQA
jgi:DNA-binding transcriptional LysR family regulator